MPGPRCSCALMDAQHWVCSWIACSIIPPSFSMYSPRAQTVPGKSGHNILKQEEAAVGAEILSSSPISGNREIFAGKVTN